MKKFLVLLKKELKELITMQLILPLIIMIVVFALVGNVVSKETAKITAPQTILILNQDVKDSGDTISQILSSANFKPNVLNNGTIDDAINRAKKDNLLALIVIPQGFKQNIDKFVPQKLPVYKLLSSFSATVSARYAFLNNALSAINNYYGNYWIQKKNISIDPNIFKNPVLSDEFVVINNKQANISLTAVSGYIQKQTTFIPLILFIIIIIAAQMVATAIANEKENKTFEILLSSPINRKTIIFAKLIAAGIVSLLFAGVYIFGYKYYLGGITGGASVGISPEIIKSLGIAITPLGYLLLGTSLFMGILVALAISMILGIIADSVKSVQTVIAPFMILVMVPYFLILFLDINTLSPILKYIIYIIPFSHPFLALQDVILGNYLPIVLGIVYEFIVFMVFVIIGARIFSSDKIITLKLRFGKKKL